MLNEKFQSKQKVFIAYLTAGDRSLSETERYARVLAEAGTDILELGVPFSDPLADGPVNQRAAERALQGGTTLSDVLTLCANIKKQNPQLAVVVFTYLNPILKMTFEGFAERAKACAVDGVLVVDLPYDSFDDGAALSLRGLQRGLAEQGIKLILLASPTTSSLRLKEMGKVANSFIYYVSRTGVTGVQAELAVGLAAEVRRVREETGRPVCVGFGISTPEQVAQTAKISDGVVVGSALVRCIEQASSADEAERVLDQVARQLIGPIKPRSL